MSHIILYLDMDGVLCNFMDYFSKSTNLPILNNKMFRWSNNEWSTFVNNNGFTKLPKHKYCDALLHSIKLLQKQYPFTVEILSSSGGRTTHDQVKAQKIQWLKDHNITYKANIVAGSSKKAEYANPNTILIDDTKAVIDAFNEHNGHGILHKDLEDTITKLNSILETLYNEPKQKLYNL